MPDTDIHDRLPMMRWSVTFYQQHCSCGWFSERYGDEEDAIHEWEDHTRMHNVIPFARKAR